MNPNKKWFNLENLIYVTAFLLPAYLIRLKIFGIPTNLLEILIGIIFLIWVGNYWKIRKLPDFQKIISWKYLTAIILILSGLFISAILSQNPLKGLGIIKGWFLIPIVFSFIAIDTIKKERMENIFTSYYFSAFAVALVSIFYLFYGNLTFDGRLAAFFNSPNYLAMYLAPAILIWMEPVQNSKFKIQNLKILSILILLTVFFFTYSYAAWLAIVLSFFIVLVIKRVVSLKKIVLILIILLLLFLSQIRNNKMNTLLTYDSRSSLASRIMIWKSAGKILKDNWVVGIGPGNFQNKYLEYQKYFPFYLEWAVPHPHNIFLAFWLYGGILGIIGFLSLIYFWFGNILKERESAVKFIVLGIVLYILLHGLFDTTYFKNDLAVVFWLSLLALKK